MPGLFMQDLVLLLLVFDFKKLFETLINTPKTIHKNTVLAHTVNHTMAVNVNISTSLS
jgi:hypothetical protein